MNQQQVTHRWLDTQESKAYWSEFWADWLLNDCSLTQRLTEQAQGDFHVEVLNEGFSTPNADEQARLNLKPGARVWIREVNLYGGDAAWVYARTLIPEEGILGELNRLAKIGNRPLGAILFNDKRVRRGPIETANTLIAGESMPRPTRRSCFTFNDHAIMVAESFLSAFEDANR